MKRDSAWCLIALLISWPCWAANEQCLSAAGSELERLYCEVMAEGGGTGLPSQPDFNRNDPGIQALLLKRPAQRLGLNLPQPKKPHNPEPEGTKETGAEKTDNAIEAAPAIDASGALTDCQLDGDRIRCPRSEYVLAENQQRKALATGVLGPDNRLEIKPYNGDPDNEDAVRRYLSGAYDQYIPKMLEIGLGANTMSFTAFYNAFQTLESGGVDFEKRMAETYELLKQDRRQLGVKTRYHDELPAALSLCGPIGRTIIVCDNVGTNWVYVLADR